jgi:hypothetical protein
VHKAIGTTTLAKLQDRASLISKRLKSLQDDVQREYEAARDKVAELVTQISEARVLASKLSNVDVGALRIQLSKKLSTDVEDTQSLLASVDSRIRQIRSRLSALENFKISLESLDRQRRELERLQALSMPMQAQLDELDGVLRSAAEELSLANERLARAQALAPVDASLAQILEHGGRVGLEDGRCPLCGSKVSEDEFLGHLHHLERTIAERNDRLTDLVVEQAKVSEQLGRNKRDYETKSAEYSRLLADVQTINESLLAVQLSAKELSVALDAS